MRWLNVSVRFRETRLLVFSVLLASGCTSLGSMTVPRYADGSRYEYDVDYQQAFELAKYACRVYSFEIDYENFEDGVIVANNGISAMSYGERIGLYLKKIDATRTGISIVTKAKVKSNFFAPEWDSEIHMIISQRINQLQNTGLL